MSNYRPNPIARIAGALFLVAGLTAAAATAQSAADSSSNAAVSVDAVPFGSQLPSEMQEQMRVAFERLELTDEQRDPVQSIVERSFEQRLAVMQKHGITPERMESGDRPSMRTMRSMRGDMERIQKDTDKRLKRVLTQEQMDTWKEMERERQAHMRERMRGRQ